MAQSHQTHPSLSRICHVLLAGSRNRSSFNVLGFLSAHPREGVSTICVGIARGLVSHGRVLLVDASHDGQGISKWLNVERRPSLGTSDLQSPISDWIVHSQADIDVLVVEPVEESASNCEKALAEFQSKVATRYRFVIVDLGSLQTLRAPGWATYLHRAYVVVNSSRTSGEALGQARKELDLLKFPIAGAIMNRRVPSMSSYLHRGDA